MPVYERSRIKILLVCAQANGLTEVFHEALAWLVIPHLRWHLVGSDVDLVEDIVVLDVNNDVVHYDLKISSDFFLSSKVDKDGNGMIGYGEFLEMVLRQVRCFFFYFIIIFCWHMFTFAGRSEGDIKKTVP